MTATIKRAEDENKTFNLIQVLRFVAASAVVICHSSFYTSERLTLGSYVYKEGANGVSLFFVISGFVMILSSEKLLNRANGWREFLVKRLVRIAPIYWLVTTLKLLIMLAAASVVFHSKLNISDIVKSYLFVPALNMDNEYRPIYGVGWTLNFEMFFYLLFALSLWLKLSPIRFLSMVFIPLAIASVFKTPKWPDIGFYADPIILNFLYGMIGAKLVISKRVLPLRLSIFLMIVGALYLFIPRYGFDISMANPSVILSGIASFIIVYCSASVDYNSFIVIPKWLVYLGGASYSLYLVHPTVSPMVPTALRILGFHSSLVSVVLSVITSVVCSVIFYRICEKPLTNYLGGITKRLIPSDHVTMVSLAVSNIPKGS